MTSREKKQKTDRNTHTHTYTKERKAEHETDDEMAIGSQHIISSIPRRKRGEKKRKLDERRTTTNYITE